MLRRPAAGKVLLSTILDYETGIPINISIHKDYNEREAFVKQLKYINSGDIVIFDRGYFSQEFVYELNKRNINYLFRIPYTNNRAALRPVNG